MIGWRCVEVCFGGTCEAVMADLLVYTGRTTGENPPAATPMQRYTKALFTCTALRNALLVLTGYRKSAV